MVTIPYQARTSRTSLSTRIIFRRARESATGLYITFGLLAKASYGKLLHRRARVEIESMSLKEIMLVKNDTWGRDWKQKVSCIACVYRFPPVCLCHSLTFHTRIQFILFVSHSTILSSSFSIFSYRFVYIRSFSLTYYSLTQSPRQRILTQKESVISQRKSNHNDTYYFVVKRSGSIKSKQLFIIVLPQAEAVRK